MKKLHFYSVQLSILPPCPAVLDPIMVSKSGHRLLEKGAIQTIKALLIPRATLITPNIPETEELLGRKISRAAKMEQAAYQLLSSGSLYILLKGGHLKGILAQDIPVWQDGQRWLKEPRIKHETVRDAHFRLQLLLV